MVAGSRRLPCSAPLRPRLAVQALQIVKLEYEAANASNKFADFDWEQARAEAVVDTAGAERVLHQIEEMTR